MNDKPVVNVGTVGHIDHGREPYQVVVIGAGYRGAGKALHRALLLQLASEQAALGRVVEASVGYDKWGNAKIMDELTEAPELFLSAKMLAPEAPIRVVSSGRHGGGKGRKAHKKRAAIFGHGWQ